MDSVDLLRHEFGETVNEKRRTILSVSFSNEAYTNFELEPCTLETAMKMVSEIEEYGMTVAATQYHPCAHSGDFAEDIVFRHPAHTIKRIEIMRRKQWMRDKEDK